MKIDFIRQLQAIKKAFLAYAAASSKKVYKDTFEINIKDNYLLLRVECEDEDGYTIAFRQEVEQGFYELYQNPLEPLSINQE